jgi:hypothetical protein
MRSLTISMEPVIGMSNRFYAFVILPDQEPRWIAANGDKKRTKKGQVPDYPIKIKTRVWGIGNAVYKLTIDLPGTAEDQSIELKLNNGYHETEITI